MKVSLNWLRDYVDFDLSAVQIGELLSDRGFPYESISQVGSDTIIDFEVTSNRGDCLSHIGIARELAAATGKTLRLPEIRLSESKSSANQLVSVEIDQPALCGRYTAHVIENVKIGPTPAWMKDRIEAVGLRSVNNVVDATNYAMMELGQPPHAFDLAKIEGARILVRKAKPGERITSIDGSKCELDPDMLVIADANRPVGIAGVMGGLDTEVSSATTTILLEDASFAPLSIRTTSRKLGIKSDASYRFERTVDIEKMDFASMRTAQLITMVAGGSVAQGMVDVYPAKYQPKIVTLSLSRLKMLLGIDVTMDQVSRILNSLGFNPVVNAVNVLTCSVPTWRNDVSREVDLIEEFARLHGYGNIHTEPKINIEVAPADSRQKMLSKTRSTLNACGYFETVDVTFVDDLAAELFTGKSRQDHLAVKDVSRKSQNLLRRELLGSLVQCFKTNLNARNEGIQLYEIADTFEQVPGSQLPLEHTHVALVTQFDFRHLRGSIEALISAFNPDADVKFVPVSLTWANSGAEIYADNKLIGSAGIISPAVLDKLDIKSASPCAAELDFEILISLQAPIRKVKPVPRFPAITRDLSIIVDEQVAWSDIMAVVDKNQPRQLESVGFTDIYRGKPIEQGKKSVTFSLRFRDEDGTLTHDQVDAMQNQIVSSLAAELKAQLRTI